MTDHKKIAKGELLRIQELWKSTDPKRDVIMEGYAGRAEKSLKDGGFKSQATEAESIQTLIHQKIYQQALTRNATLINNL